MAVPSRMIEAVLRDYARFGLLLAHDRHWRGRQIIPAAWIEEATRPQASNGYGYQVWILPASGGCSRSATYVVRQSTSIPPAV